jgi:hypothetical protein
MRIILTLAFAFPLLVPATVRAEDHPDPMKVIDKAIKALGGEQKLTKALNGCTVKMKSVIRFEGNDHPVSIETTVGGLTLARSKIEGEFDGNKFEAVSVLNGNKATLRFAGQDMSLDGEELANEKRQHYLSALGALVVPAKEKGFKTEAAGEENVDNKPAAILRITGPDGKDCTMYFDKETGLPVKLVAKVRNSMGQEVMQESTYADYKEMGGIKKACKGIVKHDGQKHMEWEVRDFKVLERVDTKIFEKP